MHYERRQRLAHFKRDCLVASLDQLCQFAAVSGPLREELARLRRENHRLRQERDILAKAAAWFARESKASPNGFTGS